MEYVVVARHHHSISTSDYRGATVRLDSNDCQHLTTSQSMDLSAVEADRASN